MGGETVVGERVDGPDAGVSQPGSDAVAGGGSDAVGAPVGVFVAWLSSVDVDRLGDRERVDLVAALERVRGSVCAVQARATDAFRCSREVLAPRDVARSVGAEVALARRESPSWGDRFVGLSRALVHEMPSTMAALEAGVIGERHAVAVVAATACLSAEDRGEVDRRVGPTLGRLGVRRAAQAAGRVAAELDAASVVARMEAAVRSRRVTTRPAPDGMAYLSILGPLKDVVGAQAALVTRARAVVSGQCPDEARGGRGVGAVAADTALRLLSGRALGQLQPVQVHLVITDRALLGMGDPQRSVFEPARIPGHGPVPAPVARAWLREGLDNDDASTSTDDDTVTGSGDPGSRAARVWLRRLYTCPGGRDLVAMDSRRRLFGGLLRRMLVLRDDVCSTPWCGAPVVHADHTIAVRAGGRTGFVSGDGKCARCNEGKEGPGWAVRVIHPGPTFAGVIAAAVARAVDHAAAPAETATAAEPADEETETETETETATETETEAEAETEALVEAEAEVSARDGRERRVPRKKRPATRTRAAGGIARGRPRPPRPTRERPREIEVSTPTGRTYRSQAPPLTGWGWEPTRPPKRTLTASRLERHLINLLAAAA